MERKIGKNRRKKKRKYILGLVWSEDKRLVMRKSRNIKGLIEKVKKKGRWGKIKFDRDIEQLKRNQ